MPIEAAAKFMQSLHYGSAEWQEIYSSDRNTIEGQNGFLKDGAHESLKDATRRRVRGYTAQYLLITVLVAAGNLRKIDKFVSDLLSQETVEQQLEKRQRKLDTRSKRKNRESRVGRWGDYKPPPPATKPVTE
ncbi:hypothetical protein [Glaciibacter superstes]|uniref:hypothetical protein n=1 Tax=Glaciibacter superstes TaxID=501023 RepID=UPI0003B579FB|nr:hypothetical protein [Glaciibacter superstes]